MEHLSENAKALKLDCSFRPLEIVDAVEALVLCLIGKAHAIESYSEEIKSVSESFKLPAVIVLTRYVKFQFKTMAPKRGNIIWRDQNQCQYCAKDFESNSLTIDHILPRSKGGQNTWINLVAACKKCNQKKGDRTPEQANMQLIRKPTKQNSSVLRAVGKKQVNDLWKDYLWDFS